MLSLARQLALQAAPFLPGGSWTARPHPGWGKEYALLEHSDGRRITVEPARRAGYVRASVEYPDTPVRLTQAHQPTTEMRADRGPDVLAHAICTKLLPVYNATYPTVIAANEQARQHEEQRHAFAKRLVALVAGARIERTEPSPVVGYRTGNIERVSAQVFGELNIVTFHYVDDETTAAVMEAYGRRSP